jgi:hypothetical protein
MAFYREQWNAIATLSVGAREVGHPILLPKVRGDGNLSDDPSPLRIAPESE